MVRPSCTCGNHVNENGDSVTQNPIRDECQLDSSFVHLTSPSSNGASTSKQLSDTILFNHGLLRSNQYISSLMKVTEGNLQLEFNDNEFKDSNNLCLCNDCIQRINNAISENTEQLQIETNAYIRAVEKEQDKQRSVQKAFLINAGLHSEKLRSDEISEHELVQSAISSFEQEIMNIERYCLEHEAELTNLNQLLMEQAQISETLTLQQDELLLEYNSLEKEAKVFEDIHHQLTQQCHSVEIERSHLNHVRLHSALFEIFVDDKGVLYPLINNLRLSHRPKDDLQWAEINTAWSQLTQLLTFLCSTVKFTSRNFSIIPLMNCAKIIEIDSTGKKICHHLGVDFGSMDKKTHNTDRITASLKVFYNLFYQFLLHINMLVGDLDLSKVPYEMTVNGIGSYNLQTIDENNDVAWKGVINCIAFNLKWFSNIL